MKACMSLVLLLALSTTAAFAGSPVISGEYVEVRSNHVLAGGCTFSAEAETDANQAILAWRITEGEFANLSVVAVILGQGNLGLGQHERQTALFIDANATPAQRQALTKAFTTRHAALFGAVKSVEPAAISFRHAGEEIYEVIVPNRVHVATGKIGALDHEPSCEKRVWYAPFTADAAATLVKTVMNAYSGDGLGSTWSIPNKRSAFVGTFTFASELAAR